MKIKTTVESIKRFTQARFRDRDRAPDAEVYELKLAPANTHGSVDDGPRLHGSLFVIAESGERFTLSEELTIEITGK